MAELEAIIGVHGVQRHRAAQASGVAHDAPSSVPFSPLEPRTVPSRRRQIPTAFSGCTGNANGIVWRQRQFPAPNVSKGHELTPDARRARAGSVVKE